MKRHHKNIYFFKLLFHMCNLKNYPTPSDKKIQTLNSTNHTYHTIDGREVQSTDHPYSTTVGLKAGEQQSNAALLKVIYQKNKYSVI